MNLLPITAMIAPETTDAAKEAEKVEKVMDSSIQFFNSLKGLSLDDAISKIANGLVSFGFKLLIAILVFYIGKYIIRCLYRQTMRIMSRRSIDASLITFVLSLIRISLYFILIVTVIGILGIETSSFLAIFASAGIAVGMALSGTLQNFAGGVLILLLKPYKVGDYIETQGYAGTVKAIQIFHTVINTVDNKAIILPNGGLSTGSINNYSLEAYRRVDWTIGLSYGTDFAAAKETIVKMLLEDDRIVVKYTEDDHRKRIMQHLESEESTTAEQLDEELREAERENFLRRFFHRLTIRRRRRKMQTEIASHTSPVLPGNVRIDRSPFVGLGELADSSINLNIRAWTHSSNYWDVFFHFNERFYTELPGKGFSFPFPQLDVHLNPQEN